MGGKYSLLTAVILILLVSLISCQSYTQIKPLDMDEIKDIETIEEANKTEELDDVNEAEEPDKINDTEEPEDTGPKTHLVEIKSLGFKPQNLEIKQGDKVMFENNDFDYGGAHIIIGWKDDEKTLRFRSSRLEYEQSYEYIFNKKGSYTIVDAGLKDEDDREDFAGKIIVT